MSACCLEQLDTGLYLPVDITNISSISIFLLLF